MKPLRLVMVTRWFWPLADEAERTMARLAAGLAAAGSCPSILTARWHPRWPAEIRFSDVPVVRLSPPPEGRWNTWRYMRAMGRWLRAHQSEFDLAYVSGLRHEAYAALRALRGRRPVVLRCERAGRCGDCLWQIEAPCGRRIKRECMRAVALAAPTAPIRRELEAAGYPRTRVHDLPLGVAATPPRTAASRMAARTLLAEANVLLQLSPGAHLVVSTGRLEPGRGWEDLIAAWPAVVGRWPNARLWLSGVAPGRAAFQRLIESLSLAGRVAMIGVFDDPEALLAATDVFVAPSPEGTAVALLEAMAAELPVVAVDVPTHRCLIRDGREGLLTPGGSPAALSAAMARLLDGPELAARLATAARERAACEFSLAKTVEEHLTWFDRLTPGR